MIIDFHSHILPGLDDGAKDWDEFLAMAKIATNEGVQTIVCTPHFISGEMEYTGEKYNNTLIKARNVIKRENLDLTLIPGSEVFLTSNIPETISAGRDLTIDFAPHYILIELPRMDLPYYAEEVLFELKLMGLTPIIAHPERNLKLAKEPHLLEELISNGCLCQLNTGSITGLFGKNTQKTARLFLKKGLIHIIGSDAHSPGRRGPYFKKPISMMRKLIGAKRLHYILEVNPQAILEGKPATFVEN